MRPVRLRPHRAGAGLAVAALTALLPLLLSGCAGDGDGLVADSSCPSAPAVLEQDLAVGNLAGGGRVGPTASRAYPLELGDVAVDWACVRSITVRLEWTNSPTSGADLYVGVESPAAGVSAIGHDQQQLAFDGAHSESVSAPVVPSLASGLAEGVTVVVYSDWASLSASGVAARVRVEFGMAGA